MIKSVLRVNDIVLVFDEHGEQLAEYQGRYGEVREKILRDAPPDAVFGNAVIDLKAVSREEW